MIKEHSNKETSRSVNFESDDDELPADYQEISFEDEKKKALAILDQITNGATVSPSKNTQLKSILKPNKDPILNGDVTRSYELDKSKLKSMFDKTAKPAESTSGQQPFQFQFFNNEQAAPLPVPRILSEPPSSFYERPRPFQRQFDYSQQEYEGEEEEEEYEPGPTPQQIELERKRKNETLFFFDIDDRLKEGLDSFVRTEEISELERAWPTKRKEIGEALRTKHRKAIQRKDKHRVFNHRRRQQHQSFSNSQPRADIE